MVRDLDIVVFGATGDTGVMACTYLYFLGKKAGISSWAPAVRNLGKLKKDVLDRLKDVKPGADGLLPSDPIEANGNDHASLVKMCARTKCVLACAGPYSEYGEGVVRACAEVGTNYVDVTGETPWVEKMQAKYGAQAAANGVTMVSCAGYDSIPPDITAYLANRALYKEGDSLQRFEAFCGGSGGALPTGTLNTVLSGVAKGKRSILRTCTFGLVGQEPQKPKEVKDAQSSESARGEQSTFVPASELSNLRNNTFWSMCPGYSPLAGQFCLPHFMATINTFTVHYTAAKEGYGGFVYRERMDLGRMGPLSLFGLLPMLMGIGGSMVLGAAVALPGFCTMASNIRDRVNPPLTEKVRQNAFAGFKSTGTTTVKGYGVSKNGRRVNVNMHSDYDPGLGFTMLASCTIAAQIAKRFGSASPAKPGYHSAVVALGGDHLADALRASGVTLDVVVTVPSKL